MAVTEQFRDGKVIVTGTSQDDYIEISRRDPRTQDLLHSRFEFNVAVYEKLPNGLQGRLLFSQNYPDADSNRLVIRAARGNDSVRNSTDLSGF